MEVPLSPFWPPPLPGADQDTLRPCSTVPSWRLEGASGATQGRTAAVAAEVVVAPPMSTEATWKEYWVPQSSPLTWNENGPVGDTCAGVTVAPEGAPRS